MSTGSDRLERRYRRLLRWYPARWRRRHEEDMVSTLLDEAEATSRTSVSPGAALDLVGHGLEQRFELLLGWWPGRLRTQVAVAALVAGAGLALILLVGEVVAARYRPPAEEVHDYGPFFLSGPFLTIGVGLYLALLTAALLVVRGHGGAARLLLLGAVASTLWMAWPVWSDAYPTPSSPVLLLLGGLALLAASATIRPGRAGRRRMVGVGAAFVVALGLGLLVSKPLLGWSVGTMTASANVASAALATVLPVVGGTAVLAGAARRRRHPGWAAAIAVAALPVVGFCTIVSQVVDPAAAGPRAFIPVGYVLVVIAVALLHDRGRRRARVTG